MPVFLQRIFAILLSLFSFLTNLTGSVGNELTNKVDKFRVTSYVVVDTVQDKNNIHSEDFDIITNVILFGAATFDQSGALNIDDAKLTKAIDNLKDVIGTRNVEFSLNILGPRAEGQYDDWYAQMDAQSQLYTQAFKSGVLEDNIVNAAKKYGFDCVHFDYEYPISNEAWAEFNDFLISLDAKLGDIKLGIAVSHWDLKMSTYGVKAVDYFELMLYDVYDDMGKHATYEMCINLAQQAGLKGIPIEKVNFGLPFYSRPTDQSALWYDYAKYANLLDENGYYYDKTVEKRFWFNTPDVIADKTNYAIESGFGGVMIWHYACDLPSSNELSLLKAVGASIDKAYKA